MFVDHTPRQLPAVKHLAHSLEIYLREPPPRYLDRWESEHQAATTPFLGLASSHQVLLTNHPSGPCKPLFPGGWFQAPASTMHHLVKSCRRRVLMHQLHSVHTMGCWHRRDVSLASCHPGRRVTIKPLRLASRSVQGAGRIPDVGTGKTAPRKLILARASRRG